jgi:hypothetical protein
MDRIEHEQPNEDTETVLRSADDVTDDVLLRSATNEMGGPPTGARWTGACCGR